MASSLTSYSIAISGLNAAQYGLSTTGHNMANADTIGYTRQQVIQKDAVYQKLNVTRKGVNSVGLGTDVSIIRQIRNQFYDADYRNQASKGSFYSVKYSAGSEIESIIGELESDYKTQDVLEDVWGALNELTLYPEGIETRGTFIETCVTFMDKIKDINNGLYSYQLNLNKQVESTVKRINSIVEQIDIATKNIFSGEANGDRANDYRDTRNALIDELSTLADITVKEGEQGKIDLLINGKELYSNGTITQIGLRYSSTEYPFVEPVMGENPDEILPYGSDAAALYNIENETINDGTDDTKGALKSLLMVRGNTIANYASDNSQTDNFFIPKFQKKIDTLVHSIATMINDAVNPINKDDAPYDLEGNKGGIEVFVRSSGYDRYENLEDTNDYASLYTMGNIEINPELLKSDGYNKLALSATGDIGDVSLINGIMSQWKGSIEELGNVSIDNYYRGVISDTSIEVEEAANYYDEQNGLLDIVKNKRAALSGVSLDEELTNMIKYQHAYNASSRLINVVDSMIDKLVNGTGRVGM